MEVEVRIKQQEFEEIIARMNLTYEELAKKLDINRVYLLNIKNSKRHGFNPSAKLRRKILETLGVQFDDIFEIVRERHPRKEYAKPRPKRHRAHTVVA